jgi:hypothetical protein
MKKERAQAAKAATGKIPRVVVGLFLGFDEDGEAMVDYPGNPATSALRARSTVALQSGDRGRDAVLLFEDGNPASPLIVGLIQNAQLEPETLTLRAGRQIELKCGEASITLTRSGKVLIRGKHLLSRSSGVNMVKGATIRLN